MAFSCYEYSSRNQFVAGLRKDWLICLKKSYGQQKSIIKLKGTIGDITFYKSKDGYLAREKGGIDASRIANDPAFVRTRENGSEFGRAGQAGKVLRNVLRLLLMSSSDSRVTSRLTQQMVKVVQPDAISVRGLRNVLDGELELLQGFEFNINGKLGSTLFIPFTAVINRGSGVISVEIPAYIPANAIAAPSGTTHFKLNMAGSEIDFENGAFQTENDSTAQIAFDGATIPAQTLTANLVANSTKPLFAVLGIEFYQEVNGQMYPLKNGAYNALSLVQISGV